jgi:hypothetical protein
MKVTTTKRVEGSMEDIAEAVKRTIAYDMEDAKALEVARLVLGKDFKKDASYDENDEPVFYYEEVYTDTEA